MPPGHPDLFPSLSAEKTFSQQRPTQGPVAASPQRLPTRAVECSTASTSDLSEEELEIKRLVTELESQLQSRGPQRAPGERAGPAPLPPRSHVHTGGGRHTGDALASPQEEWLLTLAPSTRQGCGPSGSFQPHGSQPQFPNCAGKPESQRQVSQYEGGRKAHQEVCIPDPVSDVSFSKGQPKPEPSLPKGHGAPGTQHGQGLPLLLPRSTERGLSPGPCKAPGPCQDPLKLEAYSSPTAHLAPGLAFQGAELLPSGRHPSFCRYLAVPPGDTL